MTSPRFIFAALALVFFAALLPCIALPSIGGSSEAREAHVAELIRVTGEWILPLRNGVVPSKPPLYHWVTAAIGEVAGGVTPFVARLTSLMFAAGIILLTGLLGFRLAEGTSGAAGPGARHIGIGAAMVLALTYGFTQMAGDARVDMTCAFWMVLALYWLLAPFSRSRIEAQATALPLRGRHFLGFYAACGCAVLAKGPIGVVLPLVVGWACVVWLAGVRRGTVVFCKPRWGWLIFLAIALPWYVLAAQQGEGAFIDRFLFENLHRFTGGDFVNEEPLWFYLPSFLRTGLPWSLLFVAGTLQFLTEQRTRRRISPRFGAHERLQGVGLVWVLAGIVFLSLSSGKRHSYLLPLLPGMAIFVAWRSVAFLGHVRESTRAGLRRALEGSGQWAGVVVVFLLVALESFLLARPTSDTPAEAVRGWLEAHRLLLELALGGTLLVVLLGRWLGTTMRLLASCFAVVALFGAVIFIGLGIKSDLKGFDRMAAGVRAELDPATKIVVIKAARDEYFDPLLYYLGRPVSFVNPEEWVLPCDPAAQVFVARYDWFSNFAELQRARGGDVLVRGTFNQRYDEQRGRRDRAVVLFSCRS